MNRDDQIKKNRYYLVLGEGWKHPYVYILYHLQEHMDYLPGILSGESGEALRNVCIPVNGAILKGGR